MHAGPEILTSLFTLKAHLAMLVLWYCKNTHIWTHVFISPDETPFCDPHFKNSPSGDVLLCDPVVYIGVMATSTVNKKKNVNLGQSSACECVTQRCGCQSHSESQEVRRGKRFLLCLPWNILVNAVEAGLRFVFAVTGQVEGEDSECVWRLSGGCGDLNVLLKKTDSMINSNINRKTLHGLVMRQTRAWCPMKYNQ